MKRTITIKGKDYNIKQTIRALFLWEQITGRTFEIKNTMDNYIYFYCILLANNNDFMLWDDFINCLDDEPNILIELSNKLADIQDVENLLNPETENDSNEKKKE